MIDNTPFTQNNQPGTMPPSKNRLRGTVARFAVPPGADRDQLRPAVFLVGLERARNGRPIIPGSGWFEPQADWSEAGVQEGDTVIFNATFLPLSEEGLEPSLTRAPRTPLSAANQVVVVRRPLPPDRADQVLQDTLERQQEQITQAQAAMQGLEAAHSDLMGERDRLRRRHSKRLVLVTVASLVVGGLGGSVLGWTAAQPQRPQPAQQP
ncbi:hypothetical protein [Aphanothece minutissima]|uniref:hypothetical protein n=1 Tax=Aphanothece minutissima TaxID=543815 RepID=UPI0011B22413|nr:hypothetical protein [Aphanothece minutissima]